jgi:hypothetical protein
MVGVVGASRGRMTRFEQRGAVAFAFMAAALGQRC